MVQSVIACIQINSRDSAAANLGPISSYIEEAADAGATLICLPENALIMSAPGAPLPQYPEDAVEALCELAKKRCIWLLIGSIATPASPLEKFWNRSLLISNNGTIVAHYDKIHLFDVTLANGENYQESGRMEWGNDAALVDTPFGRIGLTICYDVRFPHLYRTLAQAGAQILTVPAAFTHTTGKVHWHVLLRARAIETGCYVIAPSQCGEHVGGRRTYGHSMIINPWGEIIAEGSESETGIITAMIDTEEVAKVRSMIPSLKHDRAFALRTYSA